MSLAYFEWSAPPGVDFDDREAWAMANPALGIRISEEFIERERGALSVEAFGRERLGIGDDPAIGGVIEATRWADLEDELSEIAGQVWFAVDVTPDRAWSSVGVAGYRRDGLKHVELVDHRANTDWVVVRVTGLLERHDATDITIDPNGPAGSLIPSFVEAGVHVHTVTTREYTQGCGAFYDTVIGEQLRYPPHADLTLAVAGAKKRNLGDAWVWNRRDLSAVISPLVAVTLAAYRAEPTTREFWGAWA